jgi:hypothetical protein
MAKELGDGKVRTFIVAIFSQCGTIKYLSQCLTTQVRSIASDTLQIEDIYDVGELLGSGVAGEVHSAVHRETSESSAGDRSERAI